MCYVTVIFQNHYCIVFQIPNSAKNKNNYIHVAIAINRSSVLKYVYFICNELLFHEETKKIMNWKCTVKELFRAYLHVKQRK